MIDGVLQVAVC
jgi:hypothetical protein